MSDNIENFLNKHLVKLFYGVILYFLMQLSTDFKDMKNILQQVVINQATIETRLNTIENNDKKQDEKLDEYDRARTEFYKTYKLEPKLKQ